MPMKSNKQKILFVASTFVIVAIVIVIALAGGHKKAVSGPIKTMYTSSSSSTKSAKSNPSSSNSSNASSNNSSSDKPASSGSQIGTSNSLAAPYGTLVSNHKPGQNGSNLIEQSQCITNPGASCYIKFTQNGVVKTLPTKTADTNGSVIWQWSISDAGLTSGNWQITAVATSGAQTKTTTDQLPLEVQ
jgi:hypothetical protein